MADSVVRLNPIKIFYQISQDKSWKEANVKDLVPRATWLIPVVPLVEDPDEDVTIGLISKKIHEQQNYVKGLWKDHRLRELEMLANMGNHEDLPATDGAFDPSHVLEKSILI